MKAVKKVEKKLKKKEENIDLSEMVPADNTFANEMFAIIRAQNSELFEEYFKVESDGKISFATLDDEGNTSLHYAAMGAMPGNSDAMFLATLKGVKNKNPKDNKGLTPLHIAAMKGNLRICELIISSVKDKNPKEDTGRTPLHLAAVSGNLAVCRLIIRNVQEKNPSDPNGSTPLHCAVSGGFLDICKFMIQNVKEKNPKDTNGMTPLHNAATYGHFDIFKLISKEVKDIEIWPELKNKTPKLCLKIT